MKEFAMAQSQRKDRWSADVTAHSDALDLEPKVFEKKTAGAIAKSLKRSAESSDRRKTSAFQSAMSMLTFYMNRAGRNLPSERKQTLEEAKQKLRALFGRKP
jgi:polyhydroxyalkanoate synthesis regulator protein